jgi:2-methylisocitrate lyase-like PEP mutase family enzyme
MCHGYKIWNWFNISKESPLFIFEAIFNALSTTFINKIALMGSDIPSDQLKLLKAPVFIFDNDTTGRSKALKYAELGYKVVVFPQNTIFAQYKDCNDMLKDGLSSSQISQAITEHTYSGIKAIMLLKLY